jgi:hypothetical protein
MFDTASDSAVHITLTSGLAALVIKDVLFFIVPKFRGARASVSGDKDPSFWKQEFRSAIDEKLDQRIIPILEKQTAIMESVARTQEGMVTLLERKVKR